MRSLEILQFFDSVTLSSETGYCKPDREIFEAAVRTLETPAAQVLLVGDNLHDDVEAGMKAGLPAVWLDRRNRSEPSEHIQRIASLRDVLLLV
jgi:HAD superfamily hydrolase (TIGR01509 family)